jgi:acid phosphatase type 7
MYKILTTLFCLVQFTFLFGEEEPLKITHGPYLQSPTESSITVVWFTNKKCVSRVEYKIDDSKSFYSSKPKVAISSHHGLVDANTLVHKITVPNLNPNQQYQYRVISTEITNFRAYRTLYGNSVSSDVYRIKPGRFGTINPAKESISFSVVNDIHQNAPMLSQLLKTVNWEKTDLMFYNGDIINDFQVENQVFKGFLDTTVTAFANNIPFLFVRGNHETRGVMARELMNYFPTPNGKYYYAFPHGPVYFIILDSGEDKPDSDIEYSGLAAFDPYRIEQQKWLNKIIENPDFKNAKYRIVFMHIPLYQGGTWHGALKNKELWAPILNKANIDIMFCGHTHRYAFVEKDKYNNTFPVMIGDNDTILHTDINDEQITIKVQKPDGSIIDTKTITSSK